jgi:vanillate O-demethylase ferredoxin subunit
VSAMSDGGFEIYLAWSDRCVRVELNTTALAALLAAGIPVETGCQTGGCGSCVLAFVEGDLIHKDTCLSAADRARYFCPCVSRAETRIVLAL